MYIGRNIHFRNQKGSPMAFQNRKTGTEGPAALQRAIRARLRELRARFAQSEMARRTRTPLTNVHRYMNTGKIPAEFCAALVEAFEVNPAWLLVGAGGALLTEVDSGAARVGGELLMMVEAMDAVARVRLGALTGKEQEKALRQLSDALGSYDRLRERINAQTRPVLRHLLERYSSLCSRMDLERAAGLRRACLQAAKFCDDEELLWELDNQQAMHEHLLGHVDAGLAYHLRLFARKLRDGALKDDASCSQAASLALALRDSGRFVEGRRICRAARELAAEEARDGPGFLELCVIGGSFDVELGDLESGLAGIQRAYGRFAAGQRSFASILLLRAELLAGLCSLTEGRARPYPSRGRSRVLLRHACLLEDAGELRACAEHAIGSAEHQIPSNEYEARRSRLLLTALTKPRQGLLGQFETLGRESPPQVNSPHLRTAMLSVHRAQVARLCGRHATVTEQAQADLDAVPRDRTVTIDLYAIQARNLAATPQRQALATAQGRLRDWISRGYNALRAIELQPAAF